MKHFLTIGATLAVCLPAASAHAEPSCRIPAGSTIATGRIAKLIRVPTPAGTALFACIRRSGRKISLDESYSVPRLAGRWVAWEVKGEPGRRRIAVHDLRTGRERLVDGHVAGPGLVLTARGTIVWVQEPESGDARPLYVNDTVDGGRLLDAARVDPDSLRLAGRRVFWATGDTNRTTVVR